MKEIKENKMGIFTILTRWEKEGVNDILNVLDIEVEEIDTSNIGKLEGKIPEQSGHILNGTITLRGCILPSKGENEILYDENFKSIYRLAKKFNI